MQDLIEKLKREYDFVIFDVPPMIGMNETLMLSPQLDGVLFVTRAGAVERRLMLRAKDLLSNAQVPVLGGILNGVDLRDRRYAAVRTYRYAVTTDRKRS